MDEKKKSIKVELPNGEVTTWELEIDDQARLRSPVLMLTNVETEGQCDFFTDELAALLPTLQAFAEHGTLDAPRMVGAAKGANHAEIELITRKQALCIVRAWEDSEASDV